MPCSCAGCHQPCSCHWQSARPGEPLYQTPRRKLLSWVNSPTTRASIAMNTCSALTILYSAGGGCGTSAPTRAIPRRTHHHSYHYYQPAQKHITPPSLRSSACQLGYGSAPYQEPPRCLHHHHPHLAQPQPQTTAPRSPPSHTPSPWS